MILYHLILRSLESYKAFDAVLTFFKSIDSCIAFLTFKDSSSDIIPIPKKNITEYKEVF